MKVKKTLSILNRQYPSFPMQKITKTPFKTLIATLLSQRARDDQTIKIAAELFSLADTPKKMVRLNVKRMHAILKPSGKYRQNAERIKKMSRILIKKYKSKVPNTEEELLSLPGVGRKTANILLVQTFGKNAIAVDTHVHRITNRLGWIRTETPVETEKALQNIIPKKYWKIVNRVFVRHGQTICTPQSPFCSKCKIFKFCRRINVKRMR
jgi:endonuclease-3